MKSSRKKKAEPLSQRLKTDFQKNWLLYVMLLPVLIYLIIFCYAPMYGVIIAFKNFKPRLGILGSDWVGLKYFKEFVGSVFFGRTLKNTLMISGLNLLFGFSAPIIFAILLNEVVNMRFKKVVQTITYLPHFITTVVIASLILVFTNSRWFYHTDCQFPHGTSGKPDRGSALFPGNLHHLRYLAELRLGLHRLPGGHYRHQPAAL